MNTERIKEKLSRLTKRLDHSVPDPQEPNGG